MSYLIDTQILLWWMEANERLSEDVLSVILKNRILVSAINFWEIEIKVATGKLTVSADFEEKVAKQGFEHLSVEMRHIKELRNLPPIHNDPFDRMLICQAKIADITLITSDSRIVQYPGIRILPV